MSDKTDGSGKYRLFRNYMANELGITREDIATWTKEAVQEEVAKIVGQINVQGRAERIIRAAIIKNDPSSFRLQLHDEVIRAIAAALAKDLVLSVDPKKP